MSGKEFKLGLSFDDILLVPHYSNIKSRKDISLRTQFSRSITLNIPIVSANMDTVTESRMAIAMARAGGIGVIHRFLSIEEQVREVKKVKRAEQMTIDDPFTTRKNVTLGEALAYMQTQGVSSLLVTGESGALEGILTSRDVRFKTDMDMKVSELMTPRARLVVGKKGISQARALRLLDEHKIEKLPIVSPRNRLAGLITAADFRKTREHIHAAKDTEGQLLVGAAVGVKDGVERAEQLVRAGCDALVIDIAHGHHARAVQLLRALKKRFKKTDVVAGNVVTARAVSDLVRAGADAVKVGIGPGAACSTRVVAGSGVPQITAIMECAAAARKLRVPIVADGGIKNSGDVAKAIGAGASSVMIGNLFAGSLESPGEYYIEDGGAHKMYRGLASREAAYDQAKREARAPLEASLLTGRAPEGVGFRVSYKGEVGRILENLVDGLQSGMSYSGARAISEFWKKAEFVRITEAGMKESAPRTNQA
ncbi:IMP dehydrogenase [Candidatus Kaiserbacteria bacterium RIFCSPLOWO2_01_FULL_50_24]|uniref:IMP dehydrogenase n=1 Tax=Candidatus Kaiserbacteria bacterium RIFCSPLOWO2_01_FULL_50_24 TaxID=1798507 RepID=A0A1F6EIL5_9BACT|nr:MAG: IMP dehydrogenase [Candidatus Kaiserbacteria bacterium RIFCSPLOWO2_01_FULL_50_24]